MSVPYTAKMACQSGKQDPCDSAGLHGIPPHKWTLTELGKSVSTVCLGTLALKDLDPWNARDELRPLRFKYLSKVVSLAPEQKDEDGIPKARCSDAAMQQSETH